MKNKEQEVIDMIMKMKELGYPDEKIVKDFEVKLLKLHNLKLSQFFPVNIKGADAKAHGQVIIDSEDLEENYEFATTVKGADVKAHGKVIVDSKSLMYNYIFARDAKGADTWAHEQVIIDSKDLEYNYIFAKDVKGANVRAHGQVIINSGSIEYNEKFKLIEGSDIDAHVAVINNTKIQKCKEYLNECLDTMIKEKVKVKK